MTSPAASVVLVMASVLGLAGCNPGQRDERSSPPVADTAAPAIEVATESSTPADAPVPSSAPTAVERATQAVPAAVPPVVASPVVASPVAASTVPATPARAATPPRPATVGAVSPTVRPPVVTAGLPAGAGREVVQRVCSACHSIDTVTAVGRTPAQWGDVIGLMQNMGLSASDEDLTTIHSYLSRQLPPK